MTGCGHQKQTEKPIIKPRHLVISADLFSDLGNQVIQLSLMDLLVFGSDNASGNLLLMCLFQHAPSIFLSAFAGMGVDRL